MIRVLHTIDTTGPGGAETVFVNLAKGLDPKHFKSIVAIRGPGWVCNSLRENGIEPIFISSKGGFNYKYLIDLCRIIRKYRIDLVQSHLLGSNLYCSLAGLICRVPVISTFHGFVDTSQRERFKKLKSSLINAGSRKIVFVSNHLKDHFIQKSGILPSKATTIYNGVDTSTFNQKRDDSIRRELGVAPEQALIGAIGNIRPAKGYEYLLRAARLVLDEHPQCRFLIAGQATGELYNRLIELRRNLGLENVFFFIGYRKEIEKILNNLDIYVLSSTSEGFSISTIEAIACDLPVVVTESGGPEEIVTDSVNGIVVKTKSEQSLARGILKLLRKNRLKQKTDKSYIRDNYSVKQQNEKYQKLYKEICR